MGCLATAPQRNTWAATSGKDDGATLALDNAFPQHVDSLGLFAGMIVPRFTMRGVVVMLQRLKCNLDRHRIVLVIRFHPKPPRAS